MPQCTLTSFVDNRNSGNLTRDCCEYRYFPARLAKAKGQGISFCRSYLCFVYTAQVGKPVMFRSQPQRKKKSGDGSQVNKRLAEEERIRRKFFTV